MRKNLHTADLVLAQRKRLAAVAEFNTLLEVARTRAAGMDDALMAEAEGYREYVRGAADDDDERASRTAVVFDTIEDRLSNIEARHGEQVASRYYRTATDQRDWTEIDEHLAAYIAEHPAKPHTNYKRRQVIEALKNWRSTLTVEAITEDVARAFVEEVLAPGATPATINGKLGDLSGYWKWMRKRGRVPKTVENHWPDHRRKKSKKPPEERERGFTPEEMKALFKATPKRADLSDMMQLGALTGARLDERARLTVKHVDVDGGRLTIPGTKTEAAWREIPLHPALGSGLN